MKNIRSNFKNLMVLLTGLLTLNGCSSLDMDSWSDPAFADRPLGKTLVVAIAESEYTCRMFEQSFVAELQGSSIDASSCHAILQPKEKLTEEQLENELTANAYDSVIITRLMGEKSDSQYVYAGYTTSPTFSNYHHHYHGYYSSYAISPVSYVDSFTGYRLETNVFDVKSGKMVWGGIKTVYDFDSQETNIRKVVSAVINDFSRKKML